MDESRIKREMRDLEVKIHYHFNEIAWLSKAMCSIKIEVEGLGKNGSEHSNDGLATVGDTILKAVIADKLYRDDNVRTKGGITAKKSRLEKNAVMHKLVIDEGLIDYSYNQYHFYKDPDKEKHQLVVCKDHDPYVEAIVGAVYFDSNYDTTRRWILKWLLPLLEKYALKIEKEPTEE